jgi:hypothetical protein
MRHRVISMFLNSVPELHVKITWLTSEELKSKAIPVQAVEAHVVVRC